MRTARADFALHLAVETILAVLVGAAVAIVLVIKLTND